MAHHGAKGGKEIWKWVRRYKGLYKVSTKGKVKSVERKCKGAWGKCERIVKERILKPGKTASGGYLYVGLRKNNKCERINLHILVLEAFRGKCPAGMEARHLDDNKHNPKLSNLVWGTRKQNRKDALRNGKLANGERCPWSKLTTKQVKLIRKLDKYGLPRKIIAKRFGIHTMTVGEIVRREIWKHV